MLSSGETAALLAVLADERSLESHVSAFALTFKRQQHFKACCCLLLLLEVRSLEPVFLLLCLQFSLACEVMIVVRIVVLRFIGEFRFVDNVVLFLLLVLLGRSLGVFRLDVGSIGRFSLVGVSTVSSQDILVRCGELSCYLLLRLRFRRFLMLSEEILCGCAGRD
jgi:hypothetical protein